MLESTDTDARWIWSRKPPSRQVESALYTSRVSSRAFLNIISSSNLFTVLILSYSNFYISAVSSAGGTATSSTIGASAAVSAGAAGSSTGGSLAPGSGSVDSAGADSSMSASGSGVGSDGSGAGSGSGSGSSGGATVSGAGSGVGSGCGSGGVGTLAPPELPPPDETAPAPARRASSCTFVIQVAVSPELSEMQTSLVRIRLAKKSPIPLPASASHLVILAKRFLRNLSVVDPFSIVSSSASASARSATLVTPMLAYARFTWTSTFPCWYSLSFIVTLSPPSKSPSATPIVMLEDVAFIPTPGIEDNMMRSPALIIPFSVVTFTGTRPANAIRSGCLAYFCTSSPKV